MKHILVPTDFSDCAHAATTTAAEIAKQTGSEIYLLHSFITSLDWDRIPKDKEANYPEVLKDINKAKNQLNQIAESDTFKGIKTHVVFKFNYHANEIIQYSSDNKIDLIAMGSHGTTGIHELFIGSNTQKVVRQSPIPVLVIKQGQSISKMKNVILASTFKGYPDELVNKLIDFLGIFNPVIHLLTIITPEKFKHSLDYQERMKKVKQNHASKTLTVNTYNAYSVEEGVLEYASYLDADLIAIGTHGSSAAKQLIRSSLAESIVNHSNIPVLSINFNVALTQQKKTMQKKELTN